MKSLRAAIILMLLSGCAGTQGLFARSTPNESVQGLRQFIAKQVSASTENIQNELWPWMILIMVVYGGGKASGMIMYWLQQRGLRRAINGGARPPVSRPARQRPADGM